jgi:hypothetical protein
MLASQNYEKYLRVFSEYLSRNLPPQKLPEHFKIVKEKILTDFKAQLNSK